MKIAFDVGGVISKYPDKFRTLMDAFSWVDYMEVFVISDIHPKEEIVKVLRANDIDHLQVKESNIYSADYAKYGEHCKTKLCEELDVDILIDDFVGYLADGKFIRLLVMPDSSKPYWHDEWKVETESDFGRRKFNEKVS